MVVSILKSSKRFIVTIISRTGAYTPKVPIAVPAVERLWNRSDEAIIQTWPFDKLKVAIDLDEVLRGDRISILIEGQTAFFGEIISKEYERAGNTEFVIFIAQDFLRLLSDKQMNTAVFNGYHHGFHWETDIDLFNPVLEGVKPLAFVQYLNAIGNFDVRNAVVNRGKALKHNATGITEDNIAIIFQATSRTLERLWIYMQDPDAIQPGHPSQNTSPIFTDVTIDFKNVKESGNSFPDDLVPGNTFLKLRGTQEDARRTLTNTMKETWKTATLGAAADPISGADMSWKPITAIGGTVTVISDPTVFLGWDQACELSVSTTSGSLASIETLDVDDGDARRPSGWFAFNVRVDSNTNINSEFTFFVDGGKLAARIKSESGTWRLVFGGGQTTLIVGIDDEAIVEGRTWNFFFRIRPRSLTFDFWWMRNNEPPARDTGGPFFDPLLMKNLPFIDKTSITTVPKRIEKFSAVVNHTGANIATLSFGYFCGNEIGHRGTHRRNGNWALVDLSQDPLDLNPGQWYSIIIGQKGPTGNNDAPIYTTIRAIDNRNLKPNARFLQSTTGPSGPWSELQDTGQVAEAPFVLEYSDSWRTAVESRDFVVDYTNLKIDWKSGSARSGIPSSELFRIESLSVGPHPFDVVRVSEYSNPATGGILQPANEMRVPDVGEFLITFVPGIASSSFNAAFDTAAFALPVFIVKQRSVLESMRDLSQQFNAIFFVTTGLSPDFVFDPAKDIADIDIDNPGEHEYVFSLNKDVGGRETHKVTAINIGKQENETFTTFRVFGKDPVKVVKVNYPLVDILGGEEIEFPPETFSQETDEDNLWRFADALDDVFGLQIVEGEIVVQGYRPLHSDGRLDINGIVRVIDDFIENGRDTGGIANVFKIHSIKYDGQAHNTTIQLSNRNLHRATMERLEAQRNLLNGIQPTDPRFDIDKHDRKEIDTLTPDPNLFMALFVKGEEIRSLGYRRQAAFQRSHSNGYLSFHSFFPIEIGRIDNDQHPIDQIVLFQNKGKTVTVDNSGAGDGVYRVLINDAAHDFNATGGGGFDPTIVRDGLIAAINAGQEPVIASIVDSDTFEVTSEIPYTIALPSFFPANSLTINDEPQINSLDPFTNQRDLIYKWDNSTLDFIYYILKTP